MNPTFKNKHIQIRLPGSGELCTFPVDSDTRFSDVFRALITKGCFVCPQGEHPVWVLLCGDQDLVTWASEENAKIAIPAPSARSFSTTLPEF